MGKGFNIRHDLREETETIIRFDRNSGKILIWTADTEVMEKMWKWGAVQVRNSKTNAAYVLPRNWIRLGPPRKKPLSKEATM